MKKSATALLLTALMLTTLSACLPVENESEAIGAGMAAKSREQYEPETIEGWGEGVSTFAAYSWNGALLEELPKELDLGERDLWWINDGAVTALYGEDVIADGVCHEGVFRFMFSSPQEDRELAALARLSEDELRLWAREWDWESYGYMVRDWELAATYEPLPEGQWVTPGWWLPPEGLTGRGEDMYGPWPDIAGPYDENGNPIPTPEPTPFPEDRVAAEDFKFPGWEPVEDHEGYEISTVHTTADGRPLQVRLRWKNDEGYGFWAQLPAHAIDSFWEHEGEWFVKVTVPGSGEDSGDGESHEASSQVASEPESTPDPNVYDPVVSSPYCSDHDNLRESIIDSGIEVPEEGWWIDEEKVREIFGLDDNRVSAGCRDGIVNFSFMLEEDEELAQIYDTSLEEWEYRETREWPWKRWRWLAREVELYVTLNLREEPVEKSNWLPPEGATGRGDGYVHVDRLRVGGSEPEPTPFPEDRQPVEDYEPPEWEPVEGCPGYEMAVAAKADNGMPLQVRLRWQREGCQFAAEIPGHCLDTFLEHSDELWERVKLRAPGATPKRIDSNSAVASVKGE